MKTSSASQRLMELLEIDRPIIQAPMSGTSTPEMAAAVSNAGGLGSIGLGAMTPTAAEAAISAFRVRSERSLNLNVFCHRPASRNSVREAAWLKRLCPEFERVGTHPPEAIKEIYESFLDNEAMFSLVLEAKPRVVSFHFGMPGRAWMGALRETGIVLLGTATNLSEARALVAGGIHAVVAQGYEAGGHRGSFDPDTNDDRLGMLALTRLLASAIDVPVIAAGGIMDGRGIAAALRLGAGAAQLGTAFIATDESAVDSAYRRALLSDAAYHTVMTRVISGRPARCLANRFTAFGAGIAPNDVPSYPIAYDAGKALHAAASMTGEWGYGAHWAGQGAPLARSLPSGKLVETLNDELGRP